MTLATKFRLSDLAQKPFDDFPHVLEEATPFLKFAGVTAGWVAGDYVLHQVFEPTKGALTPPGYYGGKLLWGIPALIAGRILSDWIGGPRFVRALTIATVATGLIQIQYLGTASPEFNFTVFLIHEGLLIPLSLIIAGEPGKELLPFMRPGAARATRPQY